MTPESYLTVAIAGIVALATTFLTNWFSRRKIRAEAEESESNAAGVFTDTAIKLIAPLRAEVAELRIKVARLESENLVLHTWAKLLFSQVVESGGKPVTLQEVEEIHGRPDAVEPV